MIENPMVLPEPNYTPEKGKTFELDLSCLEAGVNELNRQLMEKFKRDQEAKKRGESEVA